MKIEDFFTRAKTDSLFVDKSRILVIRNRQEQTELRKLFEEKPDRFGWVRLSRCVTAEAFLPPADQVFALVRSAIRDINSTGKTAYITGISAMLAIWDSVERVSAFEQLRNLLDDTEFRFYAFVNGYSDEAQLVFSHPKYIDGNSILVVGERTDEDGVPEIRLVSPEIGKFILGAKCPSLSFYLNDFEIAGFGAQSINIQFDTAHELPAVGGSIRQVFCAGNYLRFFCNYQGGLSVKAEEWLYAKMVDAGMRMAAKDFAQSHFFQGNMSSVLKVAPRMIVGCHDEEQEVLVWMLKQSVYPSSYLYHVLSGETFDRTRFKIAYICEAVSLLGAPNERALCAERKAAIAEMLQDGMISLDVEIATFIETVKDVDSYQIIPWMTNRTKLEIHECVRRLRKSDLRTVPASFYDAIPLIEDYLSPYALGDGSLEGYFTEYRECKIANEVTIDFCEKAKNIQYPVAGVKSRDDLLNDSKYVEAALLVVDAMGLEYMPLIVSMARKRGVDIAEAKPAMARIPTSTKFNQVQWPDRRRLNGIPDLDNIIHNGVHTHGVSTDEENFVAMLEVFDEIILPAVAQALATHKKVILTADHGASRLAVLANKAKLTQTLKVKGVDDKAEDWRYLAADPNMVSPPGVASNISGDYWVVKGYDRFSKSGGKLNELHGGLSFEEVLVPFVVFEKGANYIPAAASAAPKMQFVENEDFDL